MRNTDTDMEKLHVLIVDDVDSIRDLVKGTLSSSGFQNISSAKNGYDALQLLKTEKVDLVICDWDMPNMTGMELLENIRSDQQIKDTPFIMLTGLGNSVEVKQAITAGVDDYIIKPIQPQKLLINIIKLIKRKGLV